MSNENVNWEFSKFGSRMKILAIMTLVGFILGILGWFINGIISIISIIISIVIIIYFLLLLGNIRRAGRTLNNKDFLSFSPRFLWGTIIRFVGNQLFGIGILFILILIYGGESLARMIPFIITALIGVALIIIGSILRFMAWGGLATFFETNYQLFPPNISGNGNKGAKICKIATILDMTIFLSFIGDLLRIIGYFKLASLKDLTGAPVQPMPQPVAPMPTPVEAPSANFCPECGSAITQGTKFCPSCGSEIL